MPVVPEACHPCQAPNCPVRVGLPGLGAEEGDSLCCWGESLSTLLSLMLHASSYLGKHGVHGFPIRGVWPWGSTNTQLLPIPLSTLLHELALQDQECLSLGSPISLGTDQRRGVLCPRNSEQGL